MPPKSRQGRKKGQMVKGGTDDAATLSDAIDIARWGSVADNPFRDAVFVVRDSYTPPPDGLTEEEQAAWQDSLKDYEKTLADAVVRSVREGDERRLVQILQALRHLNAHEDDQGRVKPVDPERTVAYSAYGANPDVTSKALREKGDKSGVPLTQKTVRRIFKSHKITLKRAPAGRPKASN